GGGNARRRSLRPFESRAGYHAAPPRQGLMGSVRKTFLILPAILLLAACGSGERGHTQGSGGRNFTSDAYGIAISVPADFGLREGFAGSYLQNGNWRTY